MLCEVVIRILNARLTLCGSPNRATIMHHQAQLADLVDVLAMDFDIVDKAGRRREARGRRKTLIRQSTQQSFGSFHRQAPTAVPIPGDRLTTPGGSLCQ